LAGDHAQQEIMTEGIRIDELIRSRRKTISLTITRDAKLVVRAPLRTSLKEIERLVRTKESWITEKKKQAQERLSNLVAFKVKPEGCLLFMGNPLKVIYCDSVSKVTRTLDGLLIPINQRDNARNLIEKWYKQQAKAILAQRICQISEQAGIPFKDVRITSARRRWGSCNSINRIQLTWRLIMAESRAIDYVIVHELCHVIHKNHSPMFWRKVEEIMPDYKMHRDWLKKHAYILDILAE
jgi:predicted metal-dependent hydrolase